jgi:hypothetical protein
MFLGMVLLIAQLRNDVADTQSNGFVTHACPPRIPVEEQWSCAFAIPLTNIDNKYVFVCFATKGNPL